MKHTTKQDVVKYTVAISAYLSPVGAGPGTAVTLLAGAFASIGPSAGEGAMSSEGAAASAALGAISEREFSCCLCS